MTAPVAHRPLNRDLRPREYLTEDEVERLIAAAKEGRHGHRDGALILIMYRHGLRAAEASTLLWSQVEWPKPVVMIDAPAPRGYLHVRRVKRGKPSVHPIRDDELAALEELRRRHEPEGAPYVFMSERGQRLDPRSINWLVKRAGVRAGLPLSVHAHMLRHACGYALVNRNLDLRLVQDWLGHRSVQETVRYTELAPGRFEEVWS